MPERLCAVDDALRVFTVKGSNYWEITGLELESPIPIAEQPVLPVICWNQIRRPTDLRQMPVSAEIRAHSRTAPNHASRHSRLGLHLQCGIVVLLLGRSGSPAPLDSYLQSCGVCLSCESLEWRDRRAFL